MKILFTIMLSFSITCLYAQSNITKDTSRANRLFEEAIALEDGNEKAVDLLKEAAKLYEAYPFEEKKIEIYSRLAYSYIEKNDSLLEIYAKKAIDLAITNLKIDIDDKLYYAYKGLLKKYHQKNLNFAIEYGKKAVSSCTKPSEKYFDIIFYLASNYTYSNDIISLENTIEEIEILIETDSAWNSKLPLLYRIKMQLNYLTKNYENAILYGKQCIIENKKHPVYNNIELGPIYVEIANYYAYLGHQKKAIQWINDGLKIANPTEGSIIYASYQANLSTIYGLNQDTKEKAIETGLKALVAFEKDKVTNAGYIQILNYNISSYAYDLRDYSRAKMYIEESMKYGENSYVKSHYALVLSNLNQFDQALNIIQNLLIDNFENFSDTAIYANPSKYQTVNDYNFVSKLLHIKTSSLVHRGVKNKNRKDLEVGIETSNLAIFFINVSLEKMKGFQEARFYNSQDISKLYGSQLYGIFEYYQLQKSDKYLEKLYETLEKRKAKFLLEMLQHNTISDTIAQKEQALIIQKRQYEQKLYFASKDSLDYYQTALFKANQALEVFIETVSTKNAKISSYLKYNDIVDFKTIQNNLDEQTLMIEYAYIDKKNDTYLYIFAISKSEIQTFKYPNQFLLNKINSLNQILQNPFLVQTTNRDKFIDLSHELYQILIEPIIKELGDKKKLIIIPEGKLFELPFETLLASNEKKPFHELDFLIKDFDISYQYSATIYHQLKEKAPIRDKSLLAFAPIFENGQTIDMANRSADFIVDSLYRSVDNNSFIGLPNSKVEVETIGKIVMEKGGKNTKILVDKAAKKQALISQIRSEPHQFVHIATHGIVNYQDPKLSALVCYDDDNDVEKALFFANEIQMQDIQADLVVLSSCESGIGQLVQGEGLIALNRSFIYSGANNVLFSLWKVNDEYTSGLMIDFYKFYFQSESYTTALRQAKLKMLQNPITANPRYWAAFVLIGE